LFLANHYHFLFFIAEKSFVPSKRISYFCTNRIIQILLLWRYFMMAMKKFLQLNFI